MTTFRWSVTFKDGRHIEFSTGTGQDMREATEKYIFNDDVERASAQRDEIVKAIEAHQGGTK